MQTIILQNGILHNSKSFSISILRLCELCPPKGGSYCAHKCAIYCPTGQRRT